MKGEIFLVQAFGTQKACKKGGPVYIKGLKWFVQNGESIKLWKDFWLPNGILRNLIQGPLTREEEQLTVRQCFDLNHEWNSMSISFELPENILNVIKAIPLSYDQGTEDTLTWAFSKNGNFSLKTAYLLAKGLNPLNLITKSIAWVWKNELPPKIQFFL